MTEAPLVAHIIYALSTGGMENGLVNIINRSPPDRYRHVIICLTGADEFASRITAKNVEVIELHKRAGHDFKCYWKLRQVLRKLRPDIIHSRNLAALETQLCSLGLGGVSRVHGEHGREITDVDGSNKKYLLFRKFMSVFIDHYITVSKDLEEWLVSSVGIASVKVQQIYNGVDHECFSPGSEKPLVLLPQSWQGLDGILIVGTVGRLTPVKDQQIILQVADWIRKRHPELADRLRFMIVGDGPLHHNLTQLIEKMSLQDMVWLAGDRTDVPELLPLIDVFVLPSLGEGISNTILEAMASGLPVVATAVGGNRELVEQGYNGGLFPVGDVQAFADALIPLLENTDERDRQGENARQRVISRFDWNTTVDAYLGVYDGLLGRSTG